MSGSLPPLPERPELERRTDVDARMVPLPGPNGSQVFCWGVGLPETPTPFCVTADGDQAGAHWIARRINRAAFLENALTNLCTSLATLIATQGGADVGVDARQLYHRTHGLLALGAAIQCETGPGANEEGMG